jgi:hypothetical protein
MITKPMKMKWVGYVACMGEERNAYKRSAVNLRVRHPIVMY